MKKKFLTLSILAVSLAGCATYYKKNSKLLKQGDDNDKAPQPKTPNETKVTEVTSNFQVKEETETKNDEQTIQVEPTTAKQPATETETAEKENLTETSKEQAETAEKENLAETSEEQAETVEKENLTETSKEQAEIAEKENLAEISEEQTETAKQPTFILEDAHSAIQANIDASSDFDINGIFHWTFYLGPIKQVSTHVFEEDYIYYRMRGKAHNTDYRMEKVSYDAENKKWIGKTADGTVYVLFFKQIAENSVTIYKHKCKNGMQEALSFVRPEDDSTKDHGWNAYTRHGFPEKNDTLKFSGTYQNDNESIELDDKQVIYQGKTYQKLSHHTGEQRWVGQADKKYLLVFYKNNGDNNDELLLATKILTNVEKAYKIKHDEQTFVRFTVK